MKKRVLAILCTLLVLFTPLMQGSADELGTVGESSTESELGTGKVEGETASRMRYLDLVRADIFINDAGVATIHAEAISASPQLTNLLVVAELQQLINGQWVTLRTYRYFTAANDAYIAETHTVSRGYYYRVVNTSTAYAGSDSETKVLESPSWNFYVPGTYQC